MAPAGTVYRVNIALSDVDRGLYETLELRVAQHPSESLRYLVTRLLAYALSYEEGITFSKGGLSSTDEPPIAIFDLTGQMLAHIDIGSPSAERLHRCAKLCKRYSVFTTASTDHFARELKTREVFRAESIPIFFLPLEVVDGIGERMEKATAFELVRTDGQLYVTMGKDSLGGAITETMLSSLAASG